jgi:hypothetical protein
MDKSFFAPLRYRFEVIPKLLLNVSGIAKGCKGHVRPGAK